MYDEYFTNLDYKWGKINDKKEISEILSTYINKYYNEEDDKDTWFDKIKQLAEEFGYCSNIKEYKLNPDNYKGNVSDIATVIRVALTTTTISPDLYMILKLLKENRIKNRFNKLL